MHTTLKRSINRSLNRFSFFCLIGAVLSGCGASSDNTASTAATPASAAPLTLTSSTPANGATGVSRSIAPQLVFSAGLDAATATAANVTITRAGGTAPLGLAVAGTQLTATPSQRLLPITAYTLRVETGLAGTSGEKLASAQTISFTTADAAWGTAQLIETDNTGFAQNPRIATDAGGNAIAVWEQSDGTRTNIWANRFTFGAGWGTAQLIETDNAGGAKFPQIDIDSSGNAIAVWYQSDGTRFNIWFNRYTPAGGWDTAALIETDNAGDALTPQIAFDSSGNAIAVWQQSDGTRANIWARRYTPAGSWSAAVLIETDSAGDASNPQIAIDASGNAIAVWRQHDGTRTNNWANRYTPAGGWGTATLVETDNAGDAFSPQIRIDASGNAIAVWNQHDGVRLNIWANRYTPAGGWGTAALIETDDTGGASTPRIAIDASGNAIAVWPQLDAMRANIWANRYTPAGGWGTAQLIEADNTAGATAPQIAFDASGNAVAVWYQSDGTRTNIWTNRYTPGGGWGTAALIETDNAGNASNPQIRVDAGGNAIAVWYQHDGARNNIWTNRFD